ncbi:MAG TPA: hypothetical protein VIU37_09580 [Candidatus Limnocylindrales bacterium]
MSQDVVGQPRPVPTTGFRLPEHVRRAFSSRLMLQAPAGLAPEQIAKLARELDSVVDGLDQGAFMALDAMRLLADQGNEVAKDLFDAMSADLGLTRPFSSYRR